MLDKYGRNYSVVTSPDGLTKEATLSGITFKLPSSTPDTDIKSLVESHSPPGEIEEESYRKKRADAYFEALTIETDDDRLTVVGDTLNKCIEQIETIRQATSSPATSEWGPLLAQLVTIKTMLPKGALKRPKS